MCAMKGSKSSFISCCWLFAFIEKINVFQQGMATGALVWMPAGVWLPWWMYPKLYSYFPFAFMWCHTQNDQSWWSNWQLATFLLGVRTFL